MNELHNNTVKARVADFHRRHGAVCFTDDVRWYYQDGAYRDIDPLGILAEPMDASTPEGQFKNAENVVLFHQLKLREAVKDFDDLNTRLAHTLPMDQRRELAELERLQEIVQQAKKELAEAQKKLDSAPLARRRAELKQAQEEQKQRMEEFQRKRRQIRV